jgi:hypothetical protein
MRNILENYLFPAVIFAGVVLALIFYYPVHAQIKPSADATKVMIMGGDVNMFDDTTLAGVDVRCWYITGGGISCI